MPEPRQTILEKGLLPERLDLHLRELWEHVALIIM